MAGRRCSAAPPAARRRQPAPRRARVEDLTGLPPTFIGVGALDLFVNEDIEYARRLLDAGVSTELVVVPGAYHAFDLVSPQAAVCQAFTAAKLEALRRAFGLMH